MEQLKPILKYKFWIICGVVLLVTVVGWWLGTSAKAAYIDQRWQALSALQVTPGTNTPNDAYIKGIDEVIGVLDKRQVVLDNRLYESQKSLHTWPKNVAKYMQDKQFQEPADYRAMQIYSREHIDEFKNMLATLPRHGWDKLTGAEYGIVHVDKDSDIPHVPTSKWANTTPTSKEMWDTQEDIWLTRSILDAIRKVNQDAGATKISDAPIRVISSLKFRGGTRDASGAVGAGGGASGSSGDYEGGGGYSGGEENYGNPYGGGEYSGGDMEGMGGGGQAISLNTTLTTNLDSVFGPETPQMATGGEGESSEAVAPAPGSGYGGAEKKRYIDDDPALPYRTRGFYIEVMMLHDKLPDFQAALVSMPWPTELLLIQQASGQKDELKAVVDTTSTNRRPPQAGFQGQNRKFGGPPGFAPPGNNRFGGNPGGSRFGGPRFQPGGGGRGGSFPMGGSRFGNPMDMGTEMEYPVESDYGMGMENYGSQSPYQLDGSAFGKAMNDPYLAKVGIAGLMTIYRSPQEMAAASEEAEAPAEQAPPAEAQPVEPGTENVDPMAVPTEPGTEPMPTEPGTEPMATEPGAEAPPAEAAPMETKGESAPPMSENQTPPPMTESPPAANPEPNPPKSSEGTPPTEEPQKTPSQSEP